MLENTLGKIFKSELPDTSEFKSIIDGQEMYHWVSFSKNRKVIKTFIQIDIQNANEYDLSYFKTVSINKKRNSLFNEEINSGYIKLLNPDDQQVNVKNFISNENLNFNLNFIKSNILGRNLSLSNNFRKKNIENFTIRFASAFNNGLTTKFSEQTQSFEIGLAQDIFFELEYPISIENSGNIESGYSKDIYELFIYAMNSKDEIIDVKKISNINLNSFISWTNSDVTLLNLDDVDFNRLLNFKVDATIFNNLARKVYINTTNYYWDVKNKLLTENSNDRNISPIDFISIQENNQPIDNDLINIDISQIELAPLNTLSLISNVDLRFSEYVDYKIFIKVKDKNSYIVKRYRIELIDNKRNNSENIQNINSFLNDTKVNYLINKNVLAIELIVKKNTFNKIFNNTTKIAAINVNNNNNNLSGQCFSYEPNQNDTPDLDLTDNSIVNLITSKNEIEYNFMFYIINRELTPTQLTFSFYTDDFNIYTLQKEIKIIRNEIKYEKYLTITNNNNFTNTKNSNLDINYNIKIKNFKNSNTNLDKLLLSYENIFLQQLRDNIEANIDNSSFESNIFVIVKKTIFQKDLNNKEFYFIFNKNLNPKNIVDNFEVDLFLDLKFKDDLEIHNLFSIETDNIDVDIDTKYMFEARLITLPLDFFILANNLDTIERIKNIYMINNENVFVPSDNFLLEIFQILNKLNNNEIITLNQMQFYKLFKFYSIKETSASNEIIIPSISSQKSQINQFFFENVLYEFVISGKPSPMLFFTINLSINNLVSDNNSIINMFIDKISDLFDGVYFKINNNLINCNQLVDENVNIKNLLNNNISDSRVSFKGNGLEIKIGLKLISNLAIYFHELYVKSTQDFSPYFLNFLNKNIYLKINIPSNLEFKSNQTSHKVEIKNLNQLTQYVNIDFYEFASFL